MMGEPERGSAAWWEDRYRSGDIPWDTGVVPPEVVSLVSSGLLMPGWALDLGCGSGISSRYLAAHGFRVAGVDLAHSALARGRRSAATDARSPRISAVATSVICASWPCRRPLPWTSAVFTPFPPSGSPRMWLPWPPISCRAPTICSMPLSRRPASRMLRRGSGRAKLPFLSHTSSSAGRVTAWIVTDLLPGT